MAASKHLGTAEPVLASAPHSAPAKEEIAPAPELAASYDTAEKHFVATVLDKRAADDAACHERSAKAMREFEDSFAAARKQRPDLWEAFQAERGEKRIILLIELRRLQENLVPEPAEPDYSPPSPQLELTAEPMGQDSFLIHNGVPYMLLSAAARHAGIRRETLLLWLKNNATFDDEPIESLYFKPTGNHFVSKRSVEKMVNRFERWPSAEPAGAITLQPTEEGSHYLSISDAAKITGMAGSTLRRWIRENNAPLETPLDVVRDKSSGYFYIQFHDAVRLGEHVAKYGLAPGPRSTRQRSLQPA